MRKIAVRICFALGVFASIWAMGAMIASDFIAWCVALPMGLGLPVWLAANLAAVVVPFMLFAALAFWIDETPASKGETE